MSWAGMERKARGAGLQRKALGWGAWLLAAWLRCSAGLLGWVARLGCSAGLLGWVAQLRETG